VQTVVPLAQSRGLMIEQDDALAEGAGSKAGLRLLRDAGEPLVAVCTANLIEELLGEKAKKGATTVLELTTSGVEVLERLPPPA
jgi:hypothetical protein